jgi:hypothetical protein
MVGVFYHYKLRNGVTWLWVDAAQWMSVRRQHRMGEVSPDVRDRLVFDQARFLHGLIMVFTTAFSTTYQIPIPATQTEYNTLERLGVPGNPHAFTDYRNVHVPRIYTFCSSSHNYRITMKPWSLLPPVELASQLLRPRFASDAETSDADIAAMLQAQISAVPLSSVRRYWRVRLPLSQLRYCSPSKGNISFVEAMLKESREEPHVRALAHDVLADLRAAY